MFSNPKDGPSDAQISLRIQMVSLLSTRSGTWMWAWLNPNRLSRVKGDSGSDIQAIINSLTPFEKQQMVKNKSPDGWSHSTQFAQFSFITEAMVKQALPVDPVYASAMTGFLVLYRMEAKRVQATNPIPMMPFPM